MATNEATWSNKGTLSESVDVTLRNSDDRTELTHHILEDIEEGNLETLKNEKGNENAKNFDIDNEESQRIRKLTEKGEEEKIRRLKQRQTKTLTAVSRKRTDINKLIESYSISNYSISHQLRYINTVSWIGGNVAVHMRKVDNPKCKVLSLIVDADTERCVVASLDISVEITHFSR